MGVDLAAEEQFGPYLVYERLGVGGMATVHRALERGIEGFERIVALKRLLPHLAEDASFIKSFVREAKLASLLNHVNIVQIFELGRVGTEYFISMEYIDGRDIRRILRHARKVTGPPPIHVTVGLLLQLCEALDYAHTKVDDDGHPLGLVHRDVSPSNLLCTSAGHLKVIDFGIAKAQSAQLRTQTGRVKGKLAYMAPEAIAGKELDARSDLFAAGVIAHELLTARPLFASKNEYQTLLKVQRGDIMPPSTFNQACPPELDAIVLRALARDPDDRFSGASELRDELMEMRRHYHLQTGHRDVAQWLDWAFSLEVPSGGFAGNTLDQTGSRAFGDTRSGSKIGKTPTPKPRREDDEAVEIAWGGGEQEGSVDPLVLDDVPDVSVKHLGSAEHLGAAPLLDDLGDDIPAPQPSHGHRSRELAAVRPVTADHGPRITGKSIPIQRATPVSVPVQRPSAPSIPHAQRAASIPTLPTEPRARRITAPGPGAPRPTTTGERKAERPSTTGERKAARPARSVTDVGPVDSEDGVITLRGDEGVAVPDDTDVGIPALTDDARPITKPVTTKPGMMIPKGLSLPKRAPEPADDDGIDIDLDDDAAKSSKSNAVTARAKRPSDVRVGQGMIERQSVRSPWALIVLLIIAALAGGAALFFMSSKKSETVVPEPPPTQPAQTQGTVKFVTEPADAEIAIVGQPPHVGSPWSIQLEPGNHQIHIQRAGYKGWLTKIELSANETQTLRVVLDKLGGEAAVAEAMLILSSTPLGLEVELDGKLLSVKTPIKMPIKPGPHTIVLRQDGADVWRHEIVAQPSVDYEFSPSMSEDKQRERAARGTTPAVPKRDAKPPEAPPPPAPEIKPETPPVSPDKPDKPDKPDRRSEVKPFPETPRNTERTVDRTPPRPATPQPTPVKPPEPTPPPVAVAQPVLPAPPPLPPPPVAIPRATSEPVVVPPTAVTKLSGEAPTVGKQMRADMPPVVAAKVCIDPSGRVDKVSMITKLERHTANDLSSAIKSWRYAPYKQGGVAVAACFSVSMRVK